MKNHPDWRVGGLNLLGSYIHAGFVQIWKNFYGHFQFHRKLAAMYTVHSIFEALFGSKWPTWMTIDQFLRPATLTLTGLELKIWSASSTQMSAYFETIVRALTIWVDKNDRQPFFRWNLDSLLLLISQHNQKSDKFRYKIKTAFFVFWHEWVLQSDFGKWLTLIGQLLKRK